MGKTITVANQKGGVGKTTTAVNLSSCLAEAGQNVLLIDFDPQGNATSGVEKLIREKDKYSIYDALTGNKDIEDCICRDICEGLDVLKADIYLSGLESELQENDDRGQRLAKTIRKTKENYDFTIIDCPPTLGTLTVNALVAAESVIIPIQCEYYALEGLGQIMKTIYLIRQKMNRNLSIEGILLTMYDQRTKLCGEVEKEVRDRLKENVYKTAIPRNVALAEAPSFGLPINLYAPSSRGAESYRLLAAEIMKG